MKTILLSTYPLPYNEIGSWTTMYNYYLKNGNHKIDIIISPAVSDPIADIQYVFVKEPRFGKYRISKLCKHCKYFHYWNRLEEVLSNIQYGIVHIIDNIGLLDTIHYYASKNNKRHKIKIVFHMHGYDYTIDRHKRQKFYNSIDDLVVLTLSSYHHQLCQVHSMPCEVTKINNGIDGRIFYPIDSTKKTSLKNKLGMLNEKIYFLWLSQDRPKKGLHIILRAWENLLEKYSNIELIIIGAYQKVENRKGIRWLGRISNEELPKYYQVTDFYLFSTLCHEGHPMSLTEALKCGNICLASDIDPLNEILSEGLYGRLVSFPHNPDSWVEAIAEELYRYEELGRKNPYSVNIPEKIYDLDQWCENINKLIEKWEKRLS